MDETNESDTIPLDSIENPNPNPNNEATFDQRSAEQSYTEDGEDVPPAAGCVNSQDKLSELVEFEEKWSGLSTVSLSARQRQPNQQSSETNDKQESQSENNVNFEDEMMRLEVEPVLNDLVERTVLATMNEQIVWLRKRGEQLNDVKQGIRTLNDQIREEVLIDFSEINTLLRIKLEEISDKIKEKLKDAYTVVRDSQTRILGKLAECDNDLKQQLAQYQTTSDMSTSGTVVMPDKNIIGKKLVLQLYNHRF